MAITGGPKGGDPTKLVGGKILPFRDPSKAQTAPSAVPPPEPAENKGESGRVLKKGLEVVGEMAGARKPGDVIDQSAPGLAKDAPFPNDVDVDRGAGVKARLAALGVKGAESLIKSSSSGAGRVKETPLGKIIDGNVTVESPEGLKRLENVVRVAGDLVVQESACKSVDFVALKTLVEVGGRLIIEGNQSVAVLDALENLERAKGIYVGYNATLTRLSLPKLKELDAALIVEGNPGLTEINLPSFQKGGLYLHVHDNPALQLVSLPQLTKLGEELSLVDNPRLTTVKVASSQKPAQVAAVELDHNGTPSFSHLHARES